MQWSRGFQSCDRGLCRPDTLCNLGLRQAGFSTSLEYLVQKGKLVVETVICRLHRRTCQCPAPKLFESTRHVSLLSFGVAQFEQSVTHGSSAGHTQIRAEIFHSLRVPDKARQKARRQIENLDLHTVSAESDSPSH